MLPVLRECILALALAGGVFLAVHLKSLTTGGTLGLRPCSTWHTTASQHGTQHPLPQPQPRLGNAAGTNTAVRSDALVSKHACACCTATDPAKPPAITHYATPKALAKHTQAG
jgi:hypothetical protein